MRAVAPRQIVICATLADFQQHGVVNGVWSCWLIRAISRLAMLCDPRSQNVPKTKVERVKPIEITGDQKKILGQKISTKLLLQKKKPSNSIENCQAGRRRFDPGRPLQNFPPIMARLLASSSR